MGRVKGNQRWIQRHRKDPYVNRAYKRGYRSRAVFKLEEIDRRRNLLRPGMTVVDLGASPGGWSQYATRTVGPHGRVIATDIQSMEPIENVEFIQGDFHAEWVLQKLLKRLADHPADLVLSDMAPNISGISAIDQPRAMNLAELALEFATRVVKPKGSFLVKLFQGQEFDSFIVTAKGHFSKVKLIKPNASRAHSREIYLLGIDRIALQ